MSKDITVSAFYFPNFHPDKRNAKKHYPNWTEWELIKNAPSRFPGHKQPKKPVWGFEDESSPAVMAKKIDAALDHGVDAWIFDWYYYDDGPFLERCLDEGFLNAPNCQEMKFALMWANHDWYAIHGYDPTKGDCQLDYPGRVKAETFEKIMDLVIEKYFKRPNYWKIDNCPVFSIYEINTLALSYDSTAQMFEAFELFRRKVKAAGFKDLHLNIMYWGMPNLPGGRTPKNWAEIINALKIDSTTSYTWVHHGAFDEFPKSDYRLAREKYMKVWEDTENILPVSYFPNVTMGWDNSPRAAHGVPWDHSQAHVVNPVLMHNTPSEFKKSLQMIKDRLDQNKKLPRVVTINAWNEWPETSILEPEEEFGYGYLEAIRDVFGSSR